MRVKWMPLLVASMLSILACCAPVRSSDDPTGYLANVQPGNGAGYDISENNGIAFNGDFLGGQAQAYYNVYGHIHGPRGGNGPGYDPHDDYLGQCAQSPWDLPYPVASMEQGGYNLTVSLEAGDGTNSMALIDSKTVYGVTVVP